MGAGDEDMRHRHVDGAGHGPPQSVGEFDREPDEVRTHKDQAGIAGLEEERPGLEVVPDRLGPAAEVEAIPGKFDA
jgi:hypothetical protein